MRPRIYRTSSPRPVVDAVVVAEILEKSELVVWTVKFVARLYRPRHITPVDVTLYASRYEPSAAALCANATDSARRRPAVNRGQQHTVADMPRLIFGKSFMPCLMLGS